MRILPAVDPTPEQLPILLDSRPGVLVIRGAAGSGKTTTALLRLKQLCAVWISRQRRLNFDGQVRVLVLTYNRTLEGYIAELARDQVPASDRLLLRVKTFGMFATHTLGPGSGPGDAANVILDRLVGEFGMPEAFLRDEVEYLLGRFEQERLEDYISAQRDGRGVSPRMEAATRRRLLDEVVYPYLEAKEAADVRDWNDIAIALGKAESTPWDIVIVDEAQDFSANQVRALMLHVADDHSVTFVVDAAQRIYPRSFTWKEAGIGTLTSRSLKSNYRNTRQIAAFARSLIHGMVMGDDGTLPDFTTASETGELPTLVSGRFSEQMDWILEHVVARANAAGESVAFLHPLGGGWFKYVKQRLDAAHIPWVQLTRAATWPQGDEDVALCTIHSAKGLEFDHVVFPGLSQEVTPHGEGEGDSKLENLRRLLSMGIGRARKTVTIGFKDGEASTLVEILDPATYTRVML